jgi:hypothetical protein
MILTEGFLKLYNQSFNITFSGTCSQFLPYDMVPYRIIRIQQSVADPDSNPQHWLRRFFHIAAIF